ncbi:Reticulon [Dillenia turbinata]|uniref:Reticulon-like protein n=1 Tax=Dillenia turbinata TaxID=194707 RepID=A0AAN8VS40_9MAGN
MTENSQDLCDVVEDKDGRKEMSSGASSASTSSPSSYRLFDGKLTIHESMGGGKAADIMLWKRRHISLGIAIVATAAWFLFERSGLSFLSICSNLMLILIAAKYIRAGYAAYRNTQLETVPELELSEELVNNAAASFRAKVNYVLLMAHDITLGKDFKLFFQVVVCLWIVSVIGSLFSFFTLAYIGTILSITIPALYSRYQAQVDRCAGLIHQKFSRHYKIVDENVFSRLPRGLSKEKET